MKRKRIVLLAAGLAAAACLLFLVRPSRFTEVPFKPDPALQASLDGVRDDYRKIIVLMAGAEDLDDAARLRATAAGRLLFWRKQHAMRETVAKIGGSRTGDGARQLVRYLTGGELHDADKLAFLDLVEEVMAGMPAGVSPGVRRNPLTDSLKTLWDNLQSIQLTYRQEVTKIFSQFATRGAPAAREKWDAYLGYLRGLHNREQIIGEFGDVVFPEPPAMRGGSSEIFGTDFATKTVALTFDDGPHPKYTEQVLALLRKYGIKACFFELGENLGTVDPAGEVKLSKTADFSRKVLEAGHVLANHSYSHPLLPKLSEEERASEIGRTNLLLEKVLGHKNEFFRAPYGARNAEILARVTEEGMKSIMWTVDSEDWADPIPESIAMRVLHQLTTQKQKGIILFHDIHKQSVLALSPVIEELQRQNYTFLALDKGKFVPGELPAEPARAGDTSDAAVAGNAAAVAAGGTPKTNFYRDSFAVIIGINEYQHWPKLRYAVNDANGVEEILTTKFGFKKENIRKLVNGDATRQRIMQVLGDELTDTNKVRRDDRVFFFFAGHGATRTFEDGRQVGFIVPVDADQSNYVSTAISMTQIREASDLIPAKHVYFVMDSCYSGLALSRGTGLFAKDRSYLEEVTRRAARQILTAGGGEQQVADDGPNGHSVFTWALLEGLQGKADLDGNGFITASELGAYISPIVSEFAKQTPAVGNMVGSEGGEFVFELQAEALTAQTPQLDTHALQLNDQLAALQQEVAAKQAELLKLQQSIQSETVKLAEVKRSGGPPPPVSPMAPSKAKVQANALHREGLQLYREKKYDPAIAKLEAAVQLTPKDAVLVNNLGYLYYVVGRNDDAVTWLEKTLAIDPKRKEAHENIADAYLKMGKKAEAKAHYQEFLALMPGSSRAEEIKKILAGLE